MASSKPVRRFNVFIGKDKLVQGVVIIPDGDNVRLEGRKPYQRWTYPKVSITRKVKL